MRCLIVNSPYQTGYDPLPLQLRNELRALGVDVTLSSDHIVSDSVYTTEWDGILLVNSLTWFLANRLRLTGRPFTQCLNYVFDDLRPILRVNIFDAGVKHLYTSSERIFEQIADGWPAEFGYPPLPTPFPSRSNRPSRRAVLGSVLPNIADRDFCLLAEAAKLMEQCGAGDRFCVFCSDQVDSEHLPQELRKYMIRYNLDGMVETECYSRLDYYIPAPRVTDLWGTTIPYELIRAVMNGCLPLYTFHPAMDAIRDTGLFNRGFKQFDAWVKDVRRAADEWSAALPTQIILPSQFHPSAALFASKFTAKVGDYLEAGNTPPLSLEVKSHAGSPSG